MSVPTADVRAVPAYAPQRSLQVRLLQPTDLPALLDLEREKWNPQQAATPEDMAARIQGHPLLCLGAFDGTTGRALASLFLKPIAPDFWKQAPDWAASTAAAAPHDSRSLFGISLSGRDDGGVAAIERFLWPHLRQAGWRELYLGSPIPGWAAWQAANPGGSVERYVARRRADGTPADPQLRYYHLRGFREVMCVRPNYFPHERSANHGVILRRDVDKTQP